MIDKTSLIGTCFGEHTDSVIVESIYCIRLWHERMLCRDDELQARTGCRELL